MSEALAGGELSSHVPELVPENIHRVKPVGADDSRDAREQFEEAGKERKDQEEDARDKNSQEKREPPPSPWETIHDDVTLSETAQQLVDQSPPAEPIDSPDGTAGETSPPASVSRISLTA